MKYFCVGIKGSGMAALACILSDLGHEVSGYDDHREPKYTEEGLIKRGIKIYYDQNHTLDKDTIVTYSVAFSKDHKEMVKLREDGLTIKSYAEIMKELTQSFRTIGISGTHGKTSTTHITRKLLSDKGCNYFVGDGEGYAAKGNEILVMESDEFNKHFINYYPELAIILNIELDHLECYPGGMEELKEAFRTFGNNAKFILASGDNPNVTAIKFDKPVKYLGYNDNNDIIIKNVHNDSEYTYFELYEDNKLISDFKIPLFGRHMVLDASFAIYASLMFGEDLEHIKKELLQDMSAKRRFAISYAGSNVMIDDYAHHPTEIKVTIEAARSRFPGKKVIAIFLPNTYSRTKALLNDFVTSLSTADKTYVMDIMCNREKAEDYGNITSDDLIKLIDGAEKIAVETVSKLKEYHDSVLLFMSCTSIEFIEDAYKEMIDGRN